MEKLLQLFASKPKTMVGIDISTNAIKLVQLAGSYTKPKVAAWGQVKLPEGAFSENSIAKPEPIAEALSGLIMESGTSAEGAAVSVSSSHAITKIMTMPASLHGAALEEQVSIEASHFIPYPIDEVNIDFEVLGSTDEEDTNEVLLVACRTSVIDSYVELMESVGLSLQVVDIDTYVLERGYRAQLQQSIKPKQPVVIFDIGSQTSHLVVVDNERVLYSRHQNFGVGQLINMVRREYGVSDEEAQQILLSQQPPGDFAQVVGKPFLERLKRELERGLQFFFSSGDFNKVDAVVLAGECCTMPQLGESMQAQLHINTLVLNPMKTTPLRAKCKAVNGAGPGLTLAYSLALRGLM